MYHCMTNKNKNKTNWSCMTNKNKNKKLTKVIVIQLKYYDY